MSTCPENDMHSVYLDGELPQKYALEYESHLTGCEECRKKYLRLQKTAALFKKDTEYCQLSSQDLEDSFSRLQTKLRYQHTVKNIQPAKTNRFFWVVPTVAAALAFALILPARQGNVTGVPASAAERPISISASALAGGLSSAPTVNHRRVSFISDAPVIMEEPIGRFQTTAISTDGAISPMDIFRPSFEEEQSISVKMSLSDLRSIPVQGEISIPIQMFITVSGN